MNNSALAHSVREACSIACCSRTSLYESIRCGALRAVKRGRRTLILDDDLRLWVHTLPSVTVKPFKQSSDEAKPMTDRMSSTDIQRYSNEEKSNV